MCENRRWAAELLVRRFRGPRALTRDELIERRGQAADAAIVLMDGCVHREVTESSCQFAMDE